MSRRLVALLTVIGALAGITVGASIGGTYGLAPVTAQFASSSGSIPSVTGASVADAVNTSDDGKFVQMDLGSSITLAFATGVNAEPDGTSAPDLVIDIFDGVWPACGFVYGSMDGSIWTSLFAGASSHPGCPTDPASSVSIDGAGNYVNPSQPLGSASITGFADTSNIMVDLDAYGGPVHFVRVDQAAFIAQPHNTFGFDLDSVYLLNSVAPTTTTTAAPTTTTTIAPTTTTTTTTIAPTTTTTAAPSEGCVFSHGYFKKKGAGLITVPLTVGSTTYTNVNQVKKALAAGGGGTKAVRRHLIAFLLSPGPHGPEYTSLVTEAQALLSGGSGNASALASSMGTYINTHHC